MNPLHVDLSPYHTPNYLAGMRALASGDPKRAMEILLAEPNTSPGYVLALGYAAQGYGHLEQYAEAEAAGRRALAEIDRTGCPHPPSESQFARDLAHAVQERGRRREALTLFDEAVERAKRLLNQHPGPLAAPIRLELAHTLQARGCLRFLLDDGEGSLDDLRAARKIYREVPDSEEVGHAEALTNLARVLAETGDETGAVLALREASEVATRTGNRRQFGPIASVAAQLGVGNPVGPHAGGSGR